MQMSDIIIQDGFYDAGYRLGLGICHSMLRAHAP